MIFLWDRNIPKAVPEALRMLRAPFDSEIHADRFPEFDQLRENGDESWISLLGDDDWFLLTRDHQLHRKPAEAAAIRRQRIGCFYVWGRNAKTWDMAQCLIAALPTIIEKAQSTPRPFIFRVDRNGRLTPVHLNP